MSDMTGSWKLADNIYSNFKNRKGSEFILYGKKGDWVEVIGDYGNTVIVQAEGGSRFPVNKQDLCGGNVVTPVEETIKIISEKKPRNKPAAKPAVPGKQKSMFS